LRLLNQIFDTAAKRRVNNIPVNTLAVEGELSPLGRYHLGAEVAAYLKQRRMNPRVAVVGETPTTNGIAVGIARHRLVTAQVFRASKKRGTGWISGRFQ
jgi:hypothetical protein